MRYMVQMHQDARTYRWHDSIPVTICNGFGVVTKESKSRRALEQRYLDRFRKTRTEIAIRQVGDERLVVNDSSRYRKSTFPILLAIRIDGILNTYAGVRLPESCGWESY